MNVQITHISLFQTAKVIGALYFVAAVVGVVLFFIASLVSPASRPPYSFVVLLLAPFLYALVGFIVTIIVAWFYNQVAKVVGGIEYTTTEVRDF
jgi:hypothetical protein